MKTINKCPHCETGLIPLHNDEGWRCPEGDFYIHWDGTPWMNNDSSTGSKIDETDGDVA